jgi:hypothetical protein
MNAQASSLFCYDLTYRSVKKHNKRIDSLRQSLSG